MRRLRILYPIFILAFYVAFHTLFVLKKISFGYIHIVFFLILPFVCTLPAKPIYAIVALSWLVIVPVFVLLYKVHLISVMLPIVTFTVLTGVIIFFQNRVSEIGNEWVERIKKDEETKDLNLSEYETLVRIEDELKDKEIKMFNLYEITKKMSGSLRFEDIFSVFSVFMKDNFIFRKCELAILKQEEGGPRLDRKYSVWFDKKDTDFDYHLNYEKLVGRLSEDMQMLHSSRDRDKVFFRDLCIDDEEVYRIISIPLRSEKKIVAILTIDNLFAGDIEKFMILSSQFVLEIRKVLLYETVEELAITDGLTGLFVRRYYLSRLNEEYHRSKRYNLSFAFLMIDIDDFKKCNDAYGHLVGDIVLKETARIMKENVREIDLISRYGGEEFAIILPEATRAGALLVAERIRSKIADYIFKAYDEKLKITISIGLSVFPEDSNEVKGLIDKADSALYIAKRAGKNIVSEHKK